jgi:cytoskeletal protein CcmA (bactofilin family)
MTSCFPELTYSVYLDQELSAEERRGVESHLEICASCRELVERLRLENRTIAEAFESAAATVTAAPAQPPAGFPLAWALPLMMAGILALSWTLEWISSALPVFADWVNPFNRTAILNFLLSFAFFLSSEGHTIFHWFGLAMTSVTVALLAAGGIYLLIRRWPLHIALLGAALLLPVIARPAYAIETRSGETVTVPAGQTLDDSLAAGAQYLEIDGTIHGNLIAHAQRITITGTVTGDVITSSQILDIQGTVQGNVFSFSQFATVSGKVGQSLSVFAESLELSNEGQVGGDIISFCQTENINGNVHGGITTGAATFMLRGSVDRNVHASAGRAVVASAARIGGDMLAKVRRTKDFTMEPGAVIVGKMEVRLKGNRGNPFLTLHYYLWRAVELGAVWITGLVLFWLFPSLFQGKLENSSDLLKIMGWGFVVLAALPLAAVIVALTLIGLPIAIMALAVWMAGMYLAKIFLAVVIGQRLMGAGAGGKKRIALPLLLGLLIIFVAVALPYIGGWDTLLVIVAGYGLVLTAALENWRRRRLSAA